MRHARASTPTLKFRPPHAYPNRAYPSHTEWLRSLERSPSPYSQIRMPGKEGKPAGALSTRERIMLSAA